MGDIDDLFDEYDKRKVSEKNKANDARSQRAEQEKRAVKILRDTILPIIEEYSLVIEEKGHKSSIIKNPDTSFDLLARMEFGVKKNGKTGHWPASTISFYARGESIRVETKLKVISGSDTKNETTWSFSKVNKKLVRQEIKMFIKSVLDAH